MRIIQLYPIGDTARSVLPTVDIVLVHGLDGDPIKTWEADDGTVWPRDLLTLPHYMPNIRVLSFGYRGTIRGTTSKKGIRDHATSLLVSVNDERQDSHLMARPIIFVGHSLGGVIIKQAIRMAQNEERYKSIAEVTYGVMFFATPQHGFDSNDWEKLIAHVVTRNGPAGANRPTDGMLNEIRMNCHVLTDITEDFKPLQSSLGLVTFLEGDVTDGLPDVIVNKTRGLTHDPNETSLVLSGDHLGLCKFRKDQADEFSTIYRRMKELVEKSPKAKVMTAQIRRVLDSLCGDEFHRHSERIKPTPGTCAWIGRCDQYDEWRYGDHDKYRLWVSGDPGCGKTYAAKHIISRLRKDREDVAECFLDELFEARSSCRAILRSTLHQVLKSRAGLCEPLMKVYDEAGGNTNDLWSQEKLSEVWPKIMAQVAGGTRRLTLVIDGFDQISKEDQEEFFRCLEDAKQRSSNPWNLRILLLSREYPGFTQHWIEHDFSTYKMEVDDIKADIAVTVNEELKRFAKALGYSEHIQDRLRKEIPEGAQGMYLWAKVMLEDLEYTFATEHDVEERLSALPRGIAELYDSILGRITKRNPSTGTIVKLVLKWVAFQRDRLKADELGLGLALSRARKSAGSDKTIEDKVLQRFVLGCVRTTVLYHCGQLVKFLPRGVELVHRSLYQYLTTTTERLGTDNHGKITIPNHKDWYMAVGESHADLGNLCAAFLGMSYFSDSSEGFEDVAVAVQGATQWEQKVRRRMAKHKFVRYAALTWCTHLKDAGPALESASCAFDFQTRALLENFTTEHGICWSEVWWLFNRWPRLPYPTRDARVLRDLLVHKGNITRSTAYTGRSSRRVSRASSRSVPSSMQPEPAGRAVPNADHPWPAGRLGSSARQDSEPPRPVPMQVSPSLRGPTPLRPLPQPPAPTGQAPAGLPQRADSVLLPAAYLPRLERNSEGELEINLPEGLGRLHVISLRTSSGTHIPLPGPERREGAGAHDTRGAAPAGNTGVPSSPVSLNVSNVYVEVHTYNIYNIITEVEKAEPGRRRRACLLLRFWRWLIGWQL